MTLMTPLGVICSSFPRFEKRMLLCCYRNYFQSLDLSLPLSFSFSHFFPLGMFRAFLLYYSFFFVSTPSLMFVSPLRSQFSFFEYVCVQVQGVSWCSFFESMRLCYMHLSRKMTSNTIANVPSLTLCACMYIISCQHLFVNA
jgi:hypothetical protein